MKKLILYAPFFLFCLEVSGKPSLPPSYQSIMKQQDYQKKWGNIMLATTFVGAGCFVAGAVSFATTGSLTESQEHFPCAAQWFKVGCGLSILAIYARRMAITT